MMYIMRTDRENGSPYESRPAIMEVNEATENRLVLYALKDALQRLAYACDVVIFTESHYVAAAINNMWPAAWRTNDWMTARGPAKDSGLWAAIMEELDEAGHILRAEPGTHEFCAWMRSNMPHLAADVRAFTAVEILEENQIWRDTRD